MIATDAVISVCNEHCEDFGVRARWRRHRSGARVCDPDRRDRAARRVPREGLCGAYAGAYSHRHPRCRRHHRRHRDIRRRSAEREADLSSFDRQQLGERADDRSGLTVASGGRPCPCASARSHRSRGAVAPRLPHSDCRRSSGLGSGYAERLRQHVQIGAFFGGLAGNHARLRSECDRSGAPAQTVRSSPAGRRLHHWSPGPV